MLHGDHETGLANNYPYTSLEERKGKKKKNKRKPVSIENWNWKVNWAKVLNDIWRCRNLVRFEARLSSYNEWTVQVLHFHNRKWRVLVTLDNQMTKTNNHRAKFNWTLELELKSNLRKRISSHGCWMVLGFQPISTAHWASHVLIVFGATPPIIVHVTIDDPLPMKCLPFQFHLICPFQWCSSILLFHLRW